MREIVFFVRGVPQAQGSTKAFVKNGKPIITSTNKSLKDWRILVALEAQNHAPDSVFSNAVNIKLDFMLPRPKSLPKKYWRHVKRPDLDKLIRAVCDSLTGIEEIKTFRHEVRKHNQFVNFLIDPELKKRGMKFD